MEQGHEQAAENEVAYLIQTWLLENAAMRSTRWTLAGLGDVQDDNGT